MSNRSTVTIDTKTAESIFAEITLIEKRLSALRKKVLQYLRPVSYGSDSWWEKEEQEADEDIRAGRIKELKSVNDLDKPFHELFR